MGANTKSCWVRRTVQIKYKPQSRKDTKKKQSILLHSRLCDFVVENPCTGDMNFTARYECAKFKQGA